jgi:hypothetical protein
VDFGNSAVFQRMRAFSLGLSVRGEADSLDRFQPFIFIMRIADLPQQKLLMEKRKW